MRSKRLDKMLVKLLKKRTKDVRASIVDGKVAIDGQVEIDFHRQISVFCHITWEGMEVYSRKAYYVMLHKPKGFVSATRDAEHPCVVDLFPREEPWTHELRLVGRLDRFTTGLLLLTNDGHWSVNITSPLQEKKVSKRYLVTTLTAINPFDDVVAQFKDGLHLPDNKFTCLPSVLEYVVPSEVVVPNPMETMGNMEQEQKDDAAAALHQYYLTLHEGKRHQVKCMINAYSDSTNRVIELHRDKIGNLLLDEALNVGEWRHLLPAEVVALADTSHDLYNSNSM